MPKRKKYLKLGHIWTRKFGQERYWAHCVFDYPRYAWFVRILKGSDFDTAEILIDKIPLFENLWEEAGWEYVEVRPPDGVTLGPVLFDASICWYFHPPIVDYRVNIPLGSTVPLEFEHLPVINCIRGPDGLEEIVSNGDKTNSYPPRMYQRYGPDWQQVREREVNLSCPLIEMPADVFLLSGTMHYMVNEMGTIGFGISKTIEGPCMIANRKYLEPAWSKKLTDADFETIVKRCADWIADPPVDQLGQRPTPLNVRIVSDYTELPPPQW